MTLPNDVDLFVSGLRRDDLVRQTVELFIDEVLSWDDVSYELSDGLKGVRIKRASLDRRFINVFPIAAKIQFGSSKEKLDHFVVKSASDLSVMLGHATDAFESAGVATR